MGEFEMVGSVNLDRESIVAVKIPKIEVEDSCMSPIVKEGDESKIISNGGGGGELYPITPSPNSETVEIPSSSEKTEDSETISECETPMGSRFDPFAPVDKELFALAPKKKVVRETRIPIRRQLNFDDCCCGSDGGENVEVVVLDEDEEDANLLRDLCESFLALIVSNQVKEISVESIAEGVDDGVSNVLKTPTGIPLLTGIAETCPDAPERPHFKLRRLNLNICRKLEFESCLI